MKTAVELRSLKGDWIRLPIQFESYVEADAYLLALHEQGYFLADEHCSRVRGI